MLGGLGARAAASGSEMIDALAGVVDYAEYSLLKACL
jgi:hypothetical protein